MDSISSIAKNTFVLLVARIIQIALGFFYTLYTARYLGTDGYGTISFALAVGGIFNVFSDLGLSTLAIREISRDRSLSNRYLYNISILKTLLIVLSSAAVILFVNLAGYPEKTIIVVCLITVYFILFSFSTLFYSLFQAYEKMEYMSLGSIIGSVVMLAGALAAIHFRLDIVGFSLIYCVSAGLVLAYCIAICLKRLFVFRPEFDRGFCKKALLEAWPLGALAAFVIIRFRIGTILLSMVKGDTAAGLYSAAYSLSEIATYVPAIVGAAMLPVISQYHVKSRPLFTLAYEKSVKYLFYMALLMALVVTIWAGPIIRFMFGNDFSGAVPVLCILIWSAALLYATATQGIIFIAANLQHISMKISFFAVILAIIANVMVVSAFGVAGVSMVFLLTEFSQLVLATYVLEKTGYNANLVKLYVIPVIGAALAGTGYLIMAQTRMDIGLTTVVCLALYLAVILAKGVDKEDVQLIMKLTGQSGRVKQWTHRQ